MNLEPIDTESIESSPELPIKEFLAREESEDKDKKDKKKKKEKTIWDRSFRKRRLKKPNRVAVLYLRNNGNAVPMEVEPRRGFFEIEGRTFHEDRDCIYRMVGENYPLAIIQEWSMLPIGTRRYYQSGDKESYVEYMQRKFAELQDHLLRGIRHAELVKLGERDKPKISGKAIVGLVIGLVILFAVGQAYL